MSVWRCPHCATPQPESARCWLCGRSTTSCAACRHYRRGVAGGLGLCGRNPKRLALRGTEVLPCWEATPSVADGSPAREGASASVRVGEASAPGRASRTFVPVEEANGRVGAAVRAPSAGAAVAVEPGGRWSLWGEPDA